MSINNNILRSSGYHQKNNHVRPEKIDANSTFNKLLKQGLEKKTMVQGQKCPKGTVWNYKLKQCLAKKL